MKDAGKNTSPASTPMTTKAAARVQSSETKASSGQVQKGSFAARAQSAAARSSSKK
jgi:hypothetical protein